MDLKYTTLIFNDSNQLVIQQKKKKKSISRIPFLGEDLSPAYPP